MKRRLAALDFRGKRVLVMGLGLHGGGLETVKFLLREGALVTVTDRRDRAELLPSVALLKRYRKRIRYVLGHHRMGDILNTEIIVKNPGVPPSSPYLRLARRAKIPITSDMGIFFSRCRGQIIGVSGTRGKSTTAYLIWKFLKMKYPRTLLGGNIRKSVLPLLAKIRTGDWVVLELSSFQLQDLAEEHIEQKSPNVAVLTNILRDHLNWHRTFREYVKAKSYLFRFQGSRDYLFLNPGDVILRKLSRGAPSRVIFATLPRYLIPIVDRNLGIHYRSSVALACRVARHFLIRAYTVKRILLSFHGLEGRQEYLGKFNGINFVNDTTSTIPEATIAALVRFRRLAGRGKVILIAGGQDKKLKFDALVSALRKYVDCLILLPGTATEKIKWRISKKVNSSIFPQVLREGGGDKNLEIGVRGVKNMPEAVSAAYRRAKKGDWVLLSPGAASFGLFLNEFDRGKQFVDEVRRKSSLTLGK